MNRTTGLVLAAIVALAAGCGGKTRNSGNADPYEEGLVVLLSGAGGMMGETDRIRDGLRNAGVRRAIETFRWSRGSVLSDQTGVEANRRKAHELSRRIEAFKDVSPGAPVHLIGVSAGTGLAVWAAEDLEPGVSVTAIILVASSLDTGYDLSKAMRKTQDGIYSFKSMADSVLALGVTWAGTVDRNGGLAGGLVGFGVPWGASEETKQLYKEKLHEIPWWPPDVVYGHVGDHLGATNPAYVKAKIAPIVLGQEPPRPPTSPEKEPPVEAVRGDDAAETGTPASEKPSAGPEAKEPTEVEKQVEKVREDLKGGADGSKGSGDRSRFHDWRVRRGRRDPDRAVRLPGEAAFFTRPERLP
jgi:pimeloyl-ACP methyl ester carboxylesterase